MDLLDHRCVWIRVSSTQFGAIDPKKLCLPRVSAFRSLAVDPSAKLYD